MAEFTEPGAGLESKVSVPSLVGWAFVFKAPPLLCHKSQNAGFQSQLPH